MQKKLRYAPALGLALGLCLAGSALADGGVTLTDIAFGGGAGITYHRTATPSRLAVENFFYTNGAAPSPLLLSESPQKARGTPGVALFDYDNDGYLDIYVSNGPGSPNSLYHNLLGRTGVLQFEDVATQAGVAATAQDSSGVCFGDIDNDGYEDLYVTGIGGPNILFHNNGNGTFSDITAAAGVGGGNFNHSGCAMADFNGDGLLDIVVSNTYDDWSNRQAVFLQPNYPAMENNQLFMRNAAAHGIQFTDASASSGIQSIAGFPGGTFTWSVSAVDYDQDGNVDILWTDLQGLAPLDPSQARGYTRLFKGDGTGHFTDITLAAGMQLGSWMGLSYGDFNCDGNIDFFATNLGRWIGGKANEPRWFLGDGHGGFTDPGIGALNALPFGWGTVTIDYDNDGDQDVLYYGDDSLLVFIAMDNPGIVLQNQGCSGNFQLDLSAIKRDHRYREVNGVATGDLNNDGFPDVVTAAMFQIVANPAFPQLLFPYQFVTGTFGTPLDNIALVQYVMAATRAMPNYFSYFGVPRPDGDLAVEINSGGNGNGWAQARLIGTRGITDDGKSNRDGIGATMKFTPDGGKTVIVPLIGGGSHASQSSSTATFGLGTAAKGTLDILWPGGTRNRLYDVNNGERVNVPEIPCSIAASWKNFGQYNSCLHHAINDLRKAQIISQDEGQRLIDSATRAFPGGGH